MKSFFKKFLIALTSFSAIVGLVACTNPEPAPSPTPVEPTEDPLAYDAGTELRMAAGYNSVSTGMSFDSSIIKSEELEFGSSVYHVGDLKPTWKFLESFLNISIVDKYEGAKAVDNFKAFSAGTLLSTVDILGGTASQMNEAGAQGKLIDLNQYLDIMPNFKAYLESNPTARISITGDVNTGAIYFSPYFDGVDDIERMPLVRADFVEKLLDGTTAYAGDNRAVDCSHYTPYMPTTGTVSVLSLTADGTSTQTITKDYSKAQNIVAQMNAATNLTGDAAVAMFRKYIDDMYGNVYDKRSDLFLGYDACWDADEMVALLRCAVASLHNSESNPVYGIAARESNNNQRPIDLFRFAGSLFGVRGMESRNDYLYLDSVGDLHDARQEAEAYEALFKMNQLVEEGLLYLDHTQKVTTTDLHKKDAFVMSYDYNQTQTICNDDRSILQDGEEYLAIMVPVAKWFDGTNIVEGVDKGVWMRFTESWRSVKTEGWALSKSGIGSDTNKLHAALKLIDFAFSVQGQITMSYGPDEFIQVKDASVDLSKYSYAEAWNHIADKYETFDFNGQAWPKVTEECFNLCKTNSGQNYTNFARNYLGSTLNGFPKSQAFEYQMTTEVGKKGSAILSAAIGKGVIKHPILGVVKDNMWYTSIPTALPTKERETEALNKLTSLVGDSTTWFSQSSGKVNDFVDIISFGKGDDNRLGKLDSAEDYAEKVEKDLNGFTYLAIKQNQWEKLYNFYDTLNK